MTNSPAKIAILASSNVMPGSCGQRADAFECEEEMAKLVPAFADFGMELDLINWRDAPNVAESYDAMLPLLVWDYFENNQDEFLSAMAKIDSRTTLLNRFSILQWNADKSYLDELEDQGAPTIPTIAVDQISEARVERAMQELGTQTVVIKPNVGGGGWRQVLYTQGEPFPSKDQRPPNGALIQPFLSRVQSEGEFSFLYFDGQFSHALRKRAKPGDYRIQSLYGGFEEAYTPSSDERAQARAVLDVLEFTPVYARVDLIPGDDGRLLLIELEMIEPYLYLPFAEGEGGENKGARKLVRAVAKKLGLENIPAR